MKAILLKAGKLRPVEIEIDYKPDNEDVMAWLRTMQNAIGASTISYVRAERLNNDLDGKNYMMIIDDNGLCKANPAPNLLAYACYETAPLFGDALLVTDAVVNEIGERDFVPIPEEELDEIKAQIMGYGDILMLMGAKEDEDAE